MSLLAVKVSVMSFLRGGSLSPASREDFDRKKDVWTLRAERMNSCINIDLYD